MCPLANSKVQGPDDSIQSLTAYEVPSSVRSLERELRTQNPYHPVLWDPMALERGLQGPRTPTLPRALAWSQTTRP